MHGGAHVFTVPMVRGRPTPQRAELRDGKVIHLQTPSYPGSAYAGGEDFIGRCRASGFEVQLITMETTRRRLR